MVKSELKMEKSEKWKNGTSEIRWLKSKKKKTVGFHDWLWITIIFEKCADW